MLSKLDSQKKAGEIAGAEKFINDLETIGKVLYADKSRLPPSSVGKSDSSKSRKNPKDAKNNKKDSSDKEKKPSIWSWKGLKALTNAKNRRFNCRFSLQVHSIEGLPAVFDDVCVVVHWKSRGIEQKTCPFRVNQGVAEFEEQLIHSSSVNVSRSGPHQLAKYEAKHFLLYVSVIDSPELDLGKHRVELTRLFPLTLEELEGEKSSGKWSTSFRLSGKAKGATLNVSFGYVAMVYNSIQPSYKNNVPEILSLRQNSVKTESSVDQFDHMDKLRIRRVESLPAKLPILSSSTENVKDLHEILPVPTSELCESVNALYQKLEMSNASVKNQFDADPFPSHVDPNKLTPPDSDDKISAIEWEISEFSVVEKGIEKFTEEHLQSEEDSLKVVQTSREALETAVNGILEVPLDEDDALRVSAEEIVFGSNEPLISTCNSTEERNEVLSKELLLKELENALSCATDLINEGLVDSQEEDESDVLHQENSKDIYFDFGDPSEGESLSLDEVTDSVASDFLTMLGIEHSPFGLSSESEPDSPRGRLLKQFENDPLANGGLLNFDIDNEPADFVSNIPTGSIWEAISKDFHHSSIYDVFKEMPEIETPKMETDAFRARTRASRLEDLETEDLMRDWGLNEKAFQHSPPSNSAEFGSPVDIPPENIEQLPPIAEGLGPFVQIENGGFLRSMNPALFKNTKIGGSLIMQVSSPVVVPLEMGAGVMDILQGLAAMGIEKLSMQANKLMPLGDITGKTIQQIAQEAAPTLQGPERQHESGIVQNIPSDGKSGKGISSGPGLGKPGPNLFGSDTEYVSLEDLAPLTMDKIEALSVEGLRIQSGMSNEDAPSNISTQSIGEFSALKGNTLDIGGSVGLAGLQLLDIKDQCEDVDGLMGLSLTLDEWVKLDSGEIDDDDLLSERTSRILAAHHATSLDIFRGRSKGDKKRGRGRKYGLLGNSFTVALMVQLRDPLRNYEPVGTPMLGLVQVERVFVPPRPKIYGAVPLSRNDNEEEQEKPSDENPIEEKIHEPTPQYKITEVNVVGLKMEPGKKKLWGSTNQQQSGSRWLLANGMGKKKKHPLMKSKAVVKNSSPASASVTTQPGDTLWSISCRVHGTGDRWKELAALNPHIRNPNTWDHEEYNGAVTFSKALELGTAQHSSLNRANAVDTGESDTLHRLHSRKPWNKKLNADYMLGEKD